MPLDCQVRPLAAKEVDEEQTSSCHFRWGGSSDNSYTLPDNLSHATSEDLHLCTLPKSEGHVQHAGDVGLHEGKCFGKGCRHNVYIAWQMETAPTNSPFCQHGLLDRGVCRRLVGGGNPEFVFEEIGKGGHWGAVDEAPPLAFCVGALNQAEW